MVTNKIVTIFSGLTLLALSVASANAGSVGELTFDYDYHDARTIYLSNGSHFGSLEFDVDLTLDALDLENFDSFGYCIDISQSIGKGSFDFYFSSLSEISSDLFYEVAWLVDTYAPGDNFEDTSNDYQDNNIASAVQGLIWEILNPPTAVTTTTNSNVYALYADYKKALSGLVLDNAMKTYLNNNYIIAQSDSYQDLIVKIEPPTPTPEPATALLFGAGVAGLLGFRRKK